MNSGNPVPRYDRFTRYLHWTMAIGIIYMTIVGYSLHFIYSPVLFKFFAELNMSLATVVAALMPARYAWRFFRPPIADAGGARVEKSGAVELAHELFYIIIFAVLISGFLMTKHGFHFFGLVYVPRLIATEVINEFFFKIHRYSCIALVLMLFLHVAAVVKHHVLDRYPIISRMV